MNKQLERPKIGIPTYDIQKTSASSVVDLYLNSVDIAEAEPIPSPSSPADFYFNSVDAAGGEPIPFYPGEHDLTKRLECLDGLILPGGGDISPTWYKGSSHPAIYSLDLERDTFEMKVAQFALDNHIPVLGICRGLQILIVLSGGTLIPHLPDEYEGVHRIDPEPEQRNPTKHMVKITKSNSSLASMVKSSKFSVVSWHHQGVRTVPSDWRVVAHAVEDGLIEAVEHKKHPWAIGVQWHPELSLNQVEHQQIFQSFVEAASAKHLRYRLN